MWIAVLILAGVFAALMLGRLAGARRRFLVRQWPALSVGVGGLYLMLRGQFAFALGLMLLAGGLYFLTERQAGRPATAREPMDLAEARAILNVRPSATTQEIRAAHRAKMAQAHPDRGGSNEYAARLNAARDLLLRGR